MKLSVEQVAQIKACEDVYPAADVARAFGVHRSTIVRVYKGRTWSTTRPTEEPPNIQTRTRAVALREDIFILLDRGMTVKEVAASLGLNYKTVYAYKKEAGK